MIQETLQTLLNNNYYFHSLRYYIITCWQIPIFEMICVIQYISCFSHSVYILCRQIVFNLKIIVTTEVIILFNSTDLNYQPFSFLWSLLFLSFITWVKQLKHIYLWINVKKHFSKIIKIDFIVQIYILKCEILRYSLRYNIFDCQRYIIFFMFILRLWWCTTLDLLV